VSGLPYTTALIVGAGPGISAAVARRLAGAGVKVALAARNIEKLSELAGEIGARTFAADASAPDSVARLFVDVDASLGRPDLVVYNASGRVRGAIVDLDPQEVRRAIEVSAFGGFLVVQQAARRMLPNKHGAILLTGATASVKGFATRLRRSVAARRHHQCLAPGQTCGARLAVGTGRCRQHRSCRSPPVGTDLPASPRRDLRACL
jgi:NAD(P)-dependent dehydrogenase (short-subunit alcohol dehydrogenase family)